MTETNRLSRRAMLRAGLALAALPLVAACSQDSSASPTAAPAAKPTESTAAKPAESKPGEAAKPAEGKPAQAAPAAPKPLTKVTYAFATKTVGALAMNIVVGQELGYYRDEGLDLDFKAISTHVALLEGIRNGSLQFAVGSPTFFLPVAAKDGSFPAVQFFEYTYPFKWDWAVSENSPIQQVGDLKGKKLGVASFGTVEQQVGSYMLKQRGIDPEKDVTWTAVGEGNTGNVALTRGDIDAMIYFDTGFGGWDAANLKYRLLPRPNDVPQIGGFFHQALPTLIRDQRPLALGFARGTAKGTIFSLENPDAGAAVFLKMIPEARVASKSDQDNIQAIKVSVARRMPLWKSSDPAVTKLGFIREQEFKDEVTFAGLTDKITDVKPFFTNELIDEANNFDAEAIKKQARDYKG